MYFDPYSFYLCVPGAQSVLIQLWPLPESAVQKFYYHFYMALYKERFITEAITLAIAELMKDNR